MGKEIPHPGQIPEGGEHPQLRRQTGRHGRRAERGISLLRPGCLSRVKGHSGQGMAEQEKITREKMAGMGEICSCYFFLPKTEDMCYNILNCADAQAGHQFPTEIGDKLY